MLINGIDIDREEPIPSASGAETRNYEPKGIQFFDARSGRHMILVDEPGYTFDGWLCWRHPDGQWVSLRKASDDDRRVLNAPIVHPTPPSDAGPRERETGTIVTAFECPACGSAVPDHVCPPTARAARAIVSAMIESHNADPHVAVPLPLPAVEDPHVHVFDGPLLTLPSIPGQYEEGCACGARRTILLTASEQPCVLGSASSGAGAVVRGTLADDGKPLPAAPAAEGPQAECATADECRQAQRCLHSCDVMPAAAEGPRDQPQPSTISPIDSSLIVPAAALPGAEAEASATLDTDEGEGARTVNRTTGAEAGTPDKMLLEFWNAVCEWERKNQRNNRHTSAELGGAYERAQAASDALTARLAALTSDVADWKRAAEVQRAYFTGAEAENARLTSEVRALKDHLNATGDDAMRDLLRQYLAENDHLAEVANRLTTERDAWKAEAAAERARVAALIDEAAARLASPSPTGAE